MGNGYHKTCGDCGKRGAMSFARRGSRRPEVLAPAGDRAALEAAVAGGADAVYFGLQGFNARARATNFDAATLKDTLDYLHRHGRRGYVTLNTLVFDDELELVHNAIVACAEAGVDAVIVQDLAVARRVRTIAPTLPLHASTQMTCTDAGAVQLAAELGAERVILARELSVAEIASIAKQSPVEVEVFVHGALCIAYSGQCLTSEAIGGRSANRGACAQACRLPYELVVDGKLQSTDERAYLLSPEDLEASSLVPQLIEAGVASLKIEGRLKGPEYVAATARLYQAAITQALDGVALDPRARHEALQTYSRGSGPGFLAGVDHQRLVEGRSCDHRGVAIGVLDEVTARGDEFELCVTLSEPIVRGDGLLVEGGLGGEHELGGQVWRCTTERGEVESAAPGERVRLWLGPHKARPAVLPRPGRRVFRNKSHAVEHAIGHAMTQDPARRAVTLTLRGALDQPPELTAALGDIQIAVTLDAPLVAARNQPLDEATAKDKLGRLGGTPFSLASLVLDVPPQSMLPLSALNRGRQAIVAQLLAALESSRPPHVVHRTSSSTLTNAVTLRPPPPDGLFVLCRNLPQAHAALDAGADGVYLDFLELTGTGDAVRALRQRPGAPFRLGLAPPRIRKPGEEKIDRYLASLAPDTTLVRGLGALRSAGSVDGLRLGDFSLNVTNRLSAYTVLGYGLDAFTPSFDLDQRQLLRLLDDAELARRAEIVLHHPMPLFHMEHCVIAALLSDGKDHKTCGRPCERHQVSLRDRAGHEHPVEADVGCRNTVFHQSAQSAAELAPKLKTRGVHRFRIELVRETAAQVAELVASYRALLSGAATPQAVWQQLRVERGYGVVRGSLRIVD